MHQVQYIEDDGEESESDQELVRPKQESREERLAKRQARVEGLSTHQPSKTRVRWLL